MSTEIVASALLLLGGLTWLGTGLLNFGENGFCDLYCSLTDLLPKVFVNVLFVLLGVLALGFASIMIYNQFKTVLPKEEKILEVEDDDAAPTVEPVVVAEPTKIEEKIDFVEKEQGQGSVTRHFKSSCCGK